MLPTSININIKVIVVGDSGVGKTSLIKTYIDQKYDANQFSTVGIDYYGKKLKHDNFDINLGIWDTAGQEKFRSIIKSFFRGADAILLVFDKGNTDSFHNVTDWINIIYEYMDINDSFQITIIGNKSDTSSVITPAEINALLLEYPTLKYIEASALANINVNRIFEETIQACLKNNT